ncbi:MAG: hypothetical protein ACE5Q3_01190 [Alphaproteobacteria bacterium]
MQPALYAFIFGAVAALSIWAVADGRLNRWLAWIVVVMAGMFFRIAGQV